MITTFWWTVLASALGQSVAFILYQGFIRSYLGIKSEEDVQKFFNKVVDYFRKLRGKPPVKPIAVYHEGKLLRSTEIKNLQAEINVRMAMIIELEKQNEELAELEKV
jgi:hypothetical protein